jgi:serine/threonine-protein kinase HipA
MDQVEVIRLTLHGRTVGHLAGRENGSNALVFDESFRNDPARPAFTLTTLPAFPRAATLLSQVWARRQRLHPVLSNLLPEGALREYMARGLKTHPDNEFRLFSFLCNDLPGALRGTPLAPEEVPQSVLDSVRGTPKVADAAALAAHQKFSLAGVQMKFSMTERDGRFGFSPHELGDWIVKTPSTHHARVPANEYTAMKLAALAGVEIPEIRLVDISSLEGLPAIRLADERLAFAIRRFDRRGGDRVHMEDFAQVFARYPADKYSASSNDSIARVLNDYSGDPFADIRQMARRLLVNVLLANGDAHLKNWSLWYPDRVVPRLAPAYDIVTTQVYIEGEQEFALNLAGTKRWYEMTMDQFRRWSERAGAPWRTVEPALRDTMERARRQWPSALDDLPVSEVHRRVLEQHWRALQPELRIG